VAVPKTSRIACTGHAAMHAPWPMHAIGLIRLAWPWTMPSTFSSGHAAMHPPEPMHTAVSTSGWIDTGTASAPRALTSVCTS
jgi:hypothetical protein